MKPKVQFHGAFGTRAKAEAKEQKVGGFIVARKIRGATRYIVMKKNPGCKTGVVRKTPIARKSMINVRHNPPAGGVQIYPPSYGVAIAGMKKGPGHPCDAKCVAAGHRYKHPFAKKVEVIGLANGDVLLRSKNGH